MSERDILITTLGPNSIGSRKSASSDRGGMVRPQRSTQIRIGSWTSRATRAGVRRDGHWTDVATVRWLQTDGFLTTQ
jgi:hypothetical protein